MIGDDRRYDRDRRDPRDDRAPRGYDPYSPRYGDAWRDDPRYPERAREGRSFDPDPLGGSGLGGVFGGPRGRDAPGGWDDRRDPRDVAGYGRRAGGPGGERGRDWLDKAGDEISSWLGDPEARRRREIDRREEGSFRGHGPKGYTRTDERIREDVSDRLADDPHLDASGIEVTVAGGEVRLSGTVRTRADRRRAEDLVDRVSGVTHVQNDLRPDPERGPDRGWSGAGPRGDDYSAREMGDRGYGRDPSERGRY